MPKFSSNMLDDIQYWLLSEADIKSRVSELAAQITSEYSHVITKEGDELVLVGILRGAIVFFADLARQITLPLSMDFMAISSYGNATKSSGVVRILKDLDRDIHGKHVIIVEDIVDSGKTLAFLKESLLQRGAKSLAICTLLDKPERRKVEIEVQYHGFVIPNEFVVGYGLDYAERYRNLPSIGVLRPEIYSE